MFQARYTRLLLPAACAFVLSVMAAPEAQAQDAKMIATGDSLFNGNFVGACWACHGKQGKGTSNGPKLSDKEWLNGDGSVEFIKGVVTSGVPKPKKAKTPMPPMGGAKLTPEQVDALAAYVKSLGG